MNQSNQFTQQPNAAGQGKSMDSCRKAAVIAVNRMWDVATDLEYVLGKYRQYMAAINRGDEEGKVLLTQLLKDFPGWMERNISTLNSTGEELSTMFDLSYRPSSRGPGATDSSGMPHGHGAGIPALPMQGKNGR